MAKFTVYFKDKATQSYIYDSGVIHIGRDESNDLVIENLAVAPAHAVVIIKPEGSVIKQLNDDFPLQVNNEKIKECILHNNDTISIGKHNIIYSSTESVTEINPSLFNKDVDFLNKKIGDTIKKEIEANIQILDGPHIGRILPLKKAMTRLGQDGSGVVVITKRKEGYFISSLETHRSIVINQQALEDKTVQLNNNDIIKIDKMSMQFYLES